MDRIIITIAASAVCLVSCIHGGNSGQQEQQAIETPANRYKLGSNTLEVGKVAGKGRIWSLNTVPIYSEIEGIIREMSLVEGQIVRKGAILAVIDDSECRIRLSELESELQKKAYEVKSTLIGIGYSRDSLDMVPAEEREAVEIMTGYSYTKVKYDNQKSLLEKHIIKAPFDGSILDVNVGKLFYAHKGEPLFYLMDTEDLVVEFEVLETMVSLFGTGMPMEFTTLSFGERKYTARLLSIAPNVGSNGTVVMTARIEGKHPELKPGMTTFINY